MIFPPPRAFPSGTISPVPDHLLLMAVTWRPAYHHDLQTGTNVMLTKTSSFSPFCHRFPSPDLMAATTNSSPHDLGLLLQTCPSNFTAFEQNVLLPFPCSCWWAIHDPGRPDERRGWQANVRSRLSVRARLTSPATNAMAASILDRPSPELGMSKVMTPQMHERGYKKGFAAAVRRGRADGADHSSVHADDHLRVLPTIPSRAVRGGMFRPDHA